MSAKTIDHSEAVAELFVGTKFEIVEGNGYDRVQLDGKTVAYAVQSKRDGSVRLDFAARPLPKKFRVKAMADRGDRMTFTVDSTNIAKGRELLEWLATA